MIYTASPRPLLRCMGWSSPFFPKKRVFWGVPLWDFRPFGLKRCYFGHFWLFWPFWAFFGLLGHPKNHVFWQINASYIPSSARGGVGRPYILYPHTTHPHGYRGRAPFAPQSHMASLNQSPPFCHCPILPFRTLCFEKRREIFYLWTQFCSHFYAKNLTFLEIFGTPQTFGENHGMCF